jgi:hypothetical protein
MAEFRRRKRFDSYLDDCNRVGDAMKLARYRFFALAVVIPVFPACGTRNTSVTAFAQESTVVSADHVFTYPHSGINDARRLVIREEAGWRALWREVVGERTPAPEVPVIDFERDMVIIAALGRRGTGGYGITIDDVSMEGGQLSVGVRETSPGPGCMTIQSFTAPVTGVRVPRSEAATTFIERHDELDCR